MRLGIFGGTFDPPHLGHLILAAEALQALGLERVLWVLTPDPPHKQELQISPLPARLEMLRASIAGEPAFELCGIELERPGPHYAVDTLRLLRERHPQDALIYLIGGDSLRDLPRWSRPAELVAACDALGVMRRPGDAVDLAALEASVPGVSAKVRYVQAPLCDIAASDIRQRVRQGRPYRYFLTPAAAEIIRQRHLYQE